MITLSQRQQEILSKIAQNGTYVTSDTLTEAFSITRRTLINDIKHINSEKMLVSSSNRGYIVNPENQQDVRELIASFEKAVDNSYMILKYLLTSKEPVAIEQIMKEFYVSQSTLFKYITAINKSLSEYGLSIERKKYSVSIEGSERDKRRLMEKLIKKESPYFFSDIENFSSYFPNLDVVSISKLVLKTIGSYGYTVPKYYEINFLINVLVILSRNPFTISQEAPTLSKSVSDYPQRKIAHEIVNRIALNYHMQYINLLETVRELEQALYGFIHPAGTKQATPTVHDLSRSFIMTIRSILEEVFAYYYLNAIDYEVFLNVFCLHVSELIKRCSGAMNFTPNNDSLRSRSPYIYEIAVSISNRIASAFNIVIPENEIDLIAIHIGYSVEQAISTANVCPLIIVTADYQDTAKYIAQTLTRKMPGQVQILGFYHSLEDVPYRGLKECLIITTIRLEEQIGNVFLVSPFFSENEFANVQAGILEFIRIKTGKEIRTLIGNYVSDDTFFILDQDMTKEEVIRYLCDKALENGDVGENFYEQVMERERLSTTAFFNRFAIPHSNIQNANETRLYIMINRQDIVWNEENTIRLVILILIKRRASDSFRKLYTGITETLYRNSDAFIHIGKIQSLNDFIRYFFE